VKLEKEILGMEAKVDLTAFLDIRMKVKQLGANMREQVTHILVHLFLSFINCYNASKVHNMLAFMLDPHFKDFSLVRDYVGHASIIEILNHAYDAHFLLPTLHELY
jgi:hypothetical protein